jgi:hypothetical protein
MYGFSVHKKVLAPKEDGWLGWDRFIDIERSTITSWNFGPTTLVESLVQTGFNPATGEMDQRTIPKERILLSTWREEAENPEGLGALRQAYKHWIYKQALEEFAAIRIERQACGIPVAYGPVEGYNKTDADLVLALLQRIRTGADGGIVCPEGWRFEMLEIGRADVPFESHIERQHQSILQCVLGQFVGLAQGGDSGAFALSRDSSSFFLLSVEGVADWVTECFNVGATRQLIGLNEARPPKKPPKLAHGKIGLRDMERWSRTLVNLFNEADVRLPGDILQVARKELDLPIGDEEKTTDGNQEQEKQTDVEGEAGIERSGTGGRGTDAL